MKKKFLKLKKVKIANVNIINRVFGGGKTDSCDADSCEATCIPPVTTDLTKDETTCSCSIINCER